MEKINFTTEDRLAIGEFVFSYQTDVLIRMDAVELVNTLARHKLITVQDQAEYIKHLTAEPPVAGIAETLMSVLQKAIPQDQLDAIMAQYYRGG